MSPLLSFMSKLLIDSTPLLSDCSDNDRSRQPEFERQCTRWITSGRQALVHSGLDTFLGEYNHIVGEEGGNITWKLPQLVGLIESAKECIEHGVTTKLKHILHAEMFDSMVAQAKGLLDTGHKVPAAVLLRIVLEGWLRDQGDKAGLVNWKTAKVSVVNEGLRTAGVFSTPKWRQIQSLLDVGNAAAHGSISEFTEGDVKRMFEFAEANCGAPNSGVTGTGEDLPF